MARPTRRAHPFPFLDYLGVRLVYDFAHFRERLPAPVGEPFDQLVNTFRWIHWISIPPILAPPSGRLEWFERSRRTTWPFHNHNPERTSTGTQTNRVTGA